jgi:rod shape-determining protein MreC
VALLDIRQRAGYLFVAVTIGHVVLVSAQVSSRSGASVLETATVGLMGEMQRGATKAIAGAERVWSGYVSLSDVEAENERLRRQLAETEMRLQAERARADRSRGLEQLLELRDRTSLDTVAAEVIAAGATPEFRTLTIGKGTTDGLQRDMAVLAPGGVVGRVVVAAPRAAKIQLLIDRNAAVGALVERSRAQGLVVGVGDGRLRFDYTSELSDVTVGDTVVTSGIDGIYPKGFTIGQVTALERVSGAYREIVVQPAVDFSTLEEVLVVVTPVPRGEEAAGAGS